VRVTSKKGNILVMVVRVRLCLLRPASYRGQPTGAALIVLLFQLLPLPPPGSFYHFYWHLLRGVIYVITTKQPSSTVCKLGACRNRARERADSGSYTGEHASKFTLDARFTGRAGELWLGPLHGLRKWGDPAFAVYLLNRKQAPLVTMWGTDLLDTSVASRLV
jgi:hypothetical protein